MTNKELAQQVFNSLAALKDGGRIATKELFSKLSPENVNEVQFRALVSHLINSGVFAGFEAKRGRNGGLFVSDRSKVDQNCLADVSEESLAGVMNPVAKAPKAKRASKNEEDSEEVEDDTELPGSKTCIKLTKNLRIAALDKRNWGFQKLSGDIWLTQGYYSSLESALENVAKRLVDYKLKTVAASDLKALAADIKATRAEIFEMLSSMRVENKEESDVQPESPEA